MRVARQLVLSAIFVGHVYELKLQLNAVCRYLLFSCDVYSSTDRVICIEGTHVVVEYYLDFGCLVLCLFV